VLDRAKPGRSLIRTGEAATTTNPISGSPTVHNVKREVRKKKNKYPEYVSENVSSYLIVHPQHIPSDKSG
jgi:hypothetical protein